METEAFKLFLKEFHSTGREKADGYSVKNLSNLALDEKLRAKDLLKSEFPGFEPAIEALAAIDKQETIKLIENEIGVNSFAKTNPSLYYWHWKLTGNVPSAETLVSLLSLQSERPYVLIGLRMIEAIPNYDFVINYLEEIIRKSTDELVKGIAISKLLKRVPSNNIDPNILPKLDSDLEHGAGLTLEKTLSYIRNNIPLATY